MRISQQNKNKQMNKLSIFKRKLNLTKRSQKMRIIYKHRINGQTYHPERFNTIQQDRDQRQSTIYGQLLKRQQSNDYGRVKMKTEYQNNFDDKYHSFDGKKISPLYKEKNKSFYQGNSDERSRKTLHNVKTLTQFHNNLQQHQTAINSLQPQIQAQQQKYNNKPSLQQIQAIITQLMQKRLQQCTKYKNRQDWKFDDQFNKIITYIRQLKQSQEYKNVGNRTRQNQVGTLDKKILLIQKLIAQNIIQSEMMKKYFLSKVTNRKNITYHQYKSEKIENNHQDVSFKQNITSTTANQQYYKTPSKSSYNKFKYQANFFNAQKLKQPLPRSSYKRDYLICPPQINFPTKAQDNHFMKTYQSAKLMNTSYNADYKQKKTKIINHKDLDAFKNKFKNLPIIFGRKQKQQLAYSLNNLNKQRQQKKQDYKSVLRDEVKAKPIQYLKTLLSQSKRQYGNDGLQKYSKSTIKHHSIQRLKRQLKVKYKI